MSGRRTKIGLIFGGQSSEHEVSLASVLNVIRAMEEKNEYDFALFGIDKEGNWHTGRGSWDFLVSTADPERMFIGVDELLGGVVAHHDGVPPQPILAGCDYFFPLTHGTKGEDGALQGFLEMLSLKVIGCGALSSAVCFDKNFLKTLLHGHGCSTVPSVKLDMKHDAVTPEAYDTISTQLDSAGLFVKPNRAGSSLGISQVENAEQLANACRQASTYDSQVLVEKNINHREFVVGIIEVGESLIVSDLGECISSPGKIYSYQEKYLGMNRLFRIADDLDEETTELIQHMAKKIFRLAACSDFARVDFFVDTDSGQIYLNEVNTIPGLTASSVFPKVFMNQGIEYADLISLMITKGIESHDRAHI